MRGAVRLRFVPRELDEIGRRREGAQHTSAYRCGSPSKTAPAARMPHRCSLYMTSTARSRRLADALDSPSAWSTLAHSSGPPMTSSTSLRCKWVRMLICCVMTHLYGQVGQILGVSKRSVRLVVARQGGGDLDERRVPPRKARYCGRTLQATSRIAKRREKMKAQVGCAARAELDVHPSSFSI